MMPDDYECHKRHASVYVPGGMEPLDDDVRLCHECAIDEILTLRKVLRTCWLLSRSSIDFDTWLQSKRNLAERVDE